MRQQNMFNYDRRRTAATQGGGSAEFMTLLESLLAVGNRQVAMKNKGLGMYDSVFIHFVNLPHGYGGAGGGAEAENNRALIEVHGFDKTDEHAPPPSGKVKVEMLRSALYSGEGAPSRETRVVMRAKTGTPEQVAKYIALFLNQVVKTVEPRYTHSEPPSSTANTPEVLSASEVTQLPVGSIVWQWVRDRVNDVPLAVIPGGQLTPVAVLPERADSPAPGGSPAQEFGHEFALVVKGKGHLPTHGTAQRAAIEWHRKQGQ